VSEERPQHEARILIVDDDEDTREVFGIELPAWGYAVLAAESGPQALAIALDWRPAAVLIDLGLPGMDGYELALRLRQLPVEPVKLIAYTGYNTEEHRERALAAGFDEYVVKGTSDDLRRLLAACLRGVSRLRAR
jgi:CheY-like chemotaxis protein